MTPVEAMRSNLERYQARRDAEALMTARFLAVGLSGRAFERAARAFELDVRCHRLDRALRGLPWR
jgi:hypothetical protein